MAETGRESTVTLYLRVVLTEFKFPCISASAAISWLFVELRAAISIPTSEAICKTETTTNKETN